MTEKNYIATVGSDHPGMEIVTITDVRLNNIMFNFTSTIKEEIKALSIPAATQGIVGEIDAANYKVHFEFKNRFTEDIEVTFWVRRRYFEDYFKKV